MRIACSYFFFPGRKLQYVPVPLHPGAAKPARTVVPEPIGWGEGSGFGPNTVSSLCAVVTSVALSATNTSRGRVVAWRVETLTPTLDEHTSHGSGAALLGALEDDFPFTNEGFSTSMSVSWNAYQTNIPFPPKRIGWSKGHRSVGRLVVQGRMHRDSSPGRPWP